jgi:hypothetical protein
VQPTGSRRALGGDAEIFDITFSRMRNFSFFNLIIDVVFVNDSLWRRVSKNKKNASRVFSVYRCLLRNHLAECSKMLHKFVERWRIFAFGKSIVFDEKTVLRLIHSSENDHLRQKMRF